MPPIDNKSNQQFGFGQIAKGLEERKQTVEGFVGSGVSDKPAKAQQGNNKSVFSSYDNNKNKKIELSDMSAKQYMLSAQKLDTKGVSEALLKELNFDAKNAYANKLNSQFKSFAYRADAMVIDPDRDVKSKLDAQVKSLNDEVQKSFNIALTNVKSAVNDKTYSELKTDYDTATQEFMQRLKQDGICEDIADGISKLWNNDVINLTGNTADMVRKDLKKYSDGLANYKKTSDKSKRAQIAKELKSMDIVNRVRNYADSQETGGFAVKATVVTGTMLACPAAAGIEGACMTLTAVNGVNAFTSQQGRENPLATGAEVLADGALTYGGAKFGKAVVKGLVKTGMVQGLGTAVNEHLAPTVAKYTNKVGGYVLGNATQSFANAGAQTSVKTAGTLAYTNIEAMNGGAASNAGTGETVGSFTDKLFNKTGQKAFERSERHATYAAIGFVKNFIHK